MCKVAGIPKWLLTSVLQYVSSGIWSKWLMHEFRKEEEKSSIFCEHKLNVLCSVRYKTSVIYSAHYITHAFYSLLPMQYFCFFKCFTHFLYSKPFFLENVVNYNFPYILGTAIKFTHYLYMTIISYFVDTNIIFLENKYMDWLTESPIMYPYFVLCVNSPYSSICKKLPKYFRVVFSELLSFKHS